MSMPGCDVTLCRHNVQHTVHYLHGSDKHLLVMLNIMIFVYCGKGNRRLLFSFQRLSSFDIKASNLMKNLNKANACIAMITLL